jgi:hypothetical protein
LVLSGAEFGEWRRTAQGGTGAARQMACSTSMLMVLKLVLCKQVQSSLVNAVTCVLDLIGRIRKDTGINHILS